MQLDTQISSCLNNDNNCFDFHIVLFLLMTHLLSFCWDEQIWKLFFFFWGMNTKILLFALAVRVFANGPGDLGSIPGRVIPKTQKMVLNASLLNTQHYKVRIKGKVEQSREGVAPSPTPWCSSYRKGSLRVTLDYGRQLYFYLPCRWPSEHRWKNICTPFSLMFLSIPKNQLKFLTSKLSRMMWSLTSNESQAFIWS